MPVCAIPVTSHYTTEQSVGEGNQDGWHGAASMYVIEKAVQDAPARKARFKSRLQTIAALNVDVPHIVSKFLNRRIEAHIKYSIGSCWVLSIASKVSDGHMTPSTPSAATKCELNLTQPNLIFLLKFFHIWSVAIKTDDIHVR